MIFQLQKMGMRDERVRSLRSEFRYLYYKFTAFIDTKVFSSFLSVYIVYPVYILYYFHGFQSVRDILIRSRRRRLPKFEMRSGALSGPLRIKDTSVRRDSRTISCCPSLNDNNLPRATDIGPVSSRAPYPHFGFDRRPPRGHR